MKRCPTCGSSYTDETLVYCLQDGATLQSEGDATNPLSMTATLRDDTQTNDASPENINLSSAPTVQIPASGLPTSPYQGARPTARGTSSPVVSSSSAITPPSSTPRVIITTVIVTVLLLGLGGVGAWMLLRRGGDGRWRERRAARANQANSNSSSALPATSPDAANTPAAPQSNNQARADNRPANQGRVDNRPDRGARWFVILGSFPKDERERAVERMESVRRQGLDARVVSSDDYSNFRSGQWVVVMGPYTRNRADEVLEQARPKIKDAYAKSGW